MDLQDKVILCVDCKKEFTHTVEDQQKFVERDFRWEPKRCPECRKARKERTARHRGVNVYGIAPIGGSSSGWGGRGRSDRSQHGGGFRSGGGFGGGGFGGGHRNEGVGGVGVGSSGEGSGGPRPSFDAVCATCGQKTTVPFEPTQGRDVYCRDCFRKRNDR